MTIIDYYRALGDHWQSAHLAAPARITYFSTLAQLMNARTSSEAKVREQHLNYFRGTIMVHPNDLKFRLLGINAARRRALDDAQKRAIEQLEIEPDVLSPLGDLRYEPSHTQLLSYFLDRARSGDGADARLRSFLKLAGVEDAYLGEIETAKVKSEHFTSEGRIDLRIELSNILIFVEVKVDSGEGNQQLKRYRKAISAESAGKATRLVFLTLPLEDANATADIHLDFRELLIAWLMVASDDRSGVREFFARYLKSILMMLGIAGGRRFPDLSFAEQNRLLGLIEEVGVKE